MPFLSLVIKVSFCAFMTLKSIMQYSTYDNLTSKSKTVNSGYLTLSYLVSVEIQIYTIYTR